MAGAVLLHALPSGAVSREFTADELARAAQDLPATTVCVSSEVAGWAWAAGARLAPHVVAAGGVVEHAGCGLRVRCVRDLPAGAELLLWFHGELAARLELPFLTPRNVRACGYRCHECDATFDDPNPLKAHLFLRCAPPEPRRVWRAVAERLAAAPPPPEPPAAWAARLEAAAAEWGRGAAGHACLYCGKLYSRKYGLKIHLRTHTGYRPLRCRHCARAFGDPSNLNKHVRLHEAPRPARTQRRARLATT